MNYNDAIEKAIKQLEELNELLKIEKKNYSVKSEFKEAFDKLINFIRNDKRCEKDNSSFTLKDGVFDYLNKTYTDQKYIVLDCIDSQAFFSNDLHDAYYLYDTYIIEIKTKRIYNVQKVQMVEMFNE